MATKTRKMVKAEQKWGEPLEVVIPNLMRVHGVDRTAAFLGVNKHTIYRWAIRLGIKLE